MRVGGYKPKQLGPNSSQSPNLISVVKFKEPIERDTSVWSKKKGMQLYWAVLKFRKCVRVGVECIEPCAPSFAAKPYSLYTWHAVLPGVRSEGFEVVTPAFAEAVADGAGAPTT